MVGCVLFLISGHVAIVEICHGRFRWMPASLGWWVVTVNQLGLDPVLRLRARRLRPAQHRRRAQRHDRQLGHRARRGLLQHRGRRCSSSSGRKHPRADPRSGPSSRADRVRVDRLGDGTRGGALCHHVAVTDRLSATDAAFLYAEDAGHADARRRGRHPGARRRRRRREFQYSDIVGPDRVAAVAGPALPAEGAVRAGPARPAGLGRRRGLRPDLPRPPLRAAEAGHRGRARRAGRPVDLPSAGPDPPALGGLRHRGPDRRAGSPLVNKTHHAMVDRIGAVDVAAAILDVNRRSRDLPEQPWIPNPAPSEIDLVVDAVADLTTRPSEVVDIVRFAAQDVRSAVTQRVQRGRQRARGGAAHGQPGTPLAAQRRARVGSAGSPPCAPTSADFKAVRGGARRLGQRRDPHRDHRGAAELAAVPRRARHPAHGGAGHGAGVGGAGPGAESDETGSVASYLIDLPVAEPNPVMRLHQVSFSMGGHLDPVSQVGADALVELGRFSPPTLHALGARVAGQLSRRMYNVLITNVPGPQVPLYAAGFPGRGDVSGGAAGVSVRRSPCRAPRTTAACSSG